MLRRRTQLRNSARGLRRFSARLYFWTISDILTFRHRSLQAQKADLASLKESLTGLDADEETRTRLKALRSTISTDPEIPFDSHFNRDLSLNLHLNLVGRKGGAGVIEGKSHGGGCR